jgi:hypothetical protein
MAITVNTLLFFFSSYSQALQSVLDLGFQYHHLYSRPSLAISCPFLIPSIFKSSSSPSYHVLRGLPLFGILSILAVAVFLTFFGFAFFQPDRNISVRGILYIRQCLPLVIGLISFYLPALPIIYGSIYFSPVFF